MKSIADAIARAAAHVTTLPVGSKLPPPPKSMTIGGSCLGPASDVPNVKTPVGESED